eukprot:28504-Amphidinium_carterae.1
MVLQALRVLQLWVQTCLLQVQGGQRRKEGDALSAGAQSKTRPQPGRGPQETSCCAKDFTALQILLQTALLAVQQQKQESLLVQDRRAHLLAQARSLADKMDQQAKIAQEANNKWEQFREELVMVYLSLEKFPTEPLPVPKTPAAPSGARPRPLALSSL